MKEMKWTPGPWKVLSSFPDEVEIVSPGRNGGPGKLVADLTVSAFDGEARQANARLISKAPEMVEALKAVHSLYRTFRDVPKDEQQWTQLDDDAIALIESLLNSINGGDK